MTSLLLPRVARRAATAVNRSIHSARSPHESGPVASTSAAPAGDRLPRAGRRSVRTASTIAPGERKNGSNPVMSFPCVDANESRTARLQAQIMLDPLPNYPATTDAEDPDGPEPAYSNVVTGYSLYRHPSPFTLDYGGHLPSFDLAYETWGTMNAAKDNVILVHTGLSASSHAKSTPANPSEGWWEKFIGSGKSIDTDKYFVICTNVLGGCYGSTGPSSLDPSDGKPYATRFPVLSIFDMVRAQLHLLDSLGVDKLYASVGSSMGGMQSIALASIGGERVARVVSISGTARSSPSSIAMRHAQRSVLMADPDWNRGMYYDGMPPHTGMKLARQIATITYRSGPEWEQRFGRQRRNLAPEPSDSNVVPLTSAPVLCPDFLIETYLDHQGESFCLKYDANSLIYISKAMDLFDMSKDSLEDLKRRRQVHDVTPVDGTACASNVIPQKKTKAKKSFISSLPFSHSYLPNLAAGLSTVTHPTLIIGVQSDTLFPIEQQRELAECLKENGNEQVVYYELNQPWGHDTFLLDVQNVGGALKGFLEK